MTLYAGQTVSATLEFATADWALVTPPGWEIFGPALIHRTLAHCSVMPEGGHGLPPDKSTVAGEKQIGAITYQTVAVSSLADGLLYVHYEAENSGLPGLAVNFYDQDAACIAAAEAVLAKLRSISGSEGTPTPFVPTAAPT